jgi:hypothetical protein
MAEPKVKGAPVAVFFRWLRDTRGSAVAAEMVEAVEPQYRELFDATKPNLGIISSSWYPAAPLHQMLDRLLRGRSREEVTELVRGSAEAVISDTLHGVYRVLFSAMMSPERYARNAQKLFSRYYDQGTMIKEAGPKSHLSTIRDWRAHHPFFCGQILYTSVYVYQAMGCKQVQSKRLSCISTGAKECAFEISWS